MINLVTEHTRIRIVRRKYEDDFVRLQGADNGEQQVHGNGRREHWPCDVGERLPRLGPVDVPRLIQIAGNRLKACKKDDHRIADRPPDLNENRQRKSKIRGTEEGGGTAEQFPYFLNWSVQRVEHQRPYEAEDGHAKHDGQEDERPKEHVAPQLRIDHDGDEQADDGLNARDGEGEHKRSPQGSIINGRPPGLEKFFVVVPSDKVPLSPLNGGNIGERVD